MRHIGPPALRTLLFAALLAAGGAAMAEEHDKPPADVTVEMVRERDLDVERRVVAILRARASYPQKLSVGVSAMFVRQPVDFECVAACRYRGWRVQLEPGLAGGALSAGWASLVGDKRLKKHRVTDVYVGYGLKATVLRTWGDAGVTPSDQTFFGLEADFSVTRVNFSAGVLRRVSSGPSDEDWILTVGLGWGF